MTDGKDPRQRKKVPTLQELDNMPEDGTTDSESSGKGKATGSNKKRNTMRVRENVGRNKKVAKAPHPKPNPKPTSKEEGTETFTNQVAGNDRTRVTSLKVEKSISRSPKKKPAPEPSGSPDGGGRYTPPPPPKIPPASEPPEPDSKQSPDEYARAMALYEAEEEWGHRMGDFDRMPNDGVRNRAYKSKCVKCDRRAIAKVVFYDNISDRWYDIGVSGEATEGPCLIEVRRSPTTKAEIQDPPRQEAKTPDSFEVTKPSRDDILDNFAREEARRVARNRRHRVNAMFLFAYPGARIHKGRCERCGRRVFGKVQKFPEDPEKSERISVYGDALKYRCSGARVKR